MQSALRDAFLVNFASALNPNSKKILAKLLQALVLDKSKPLPAESVELGPMPKEGPPQLRRDLILE